MAFDQIVARPFANGIIDGWKLISSVIHPVLYGW